MVEAKQEITRRKKTDEFSNGGYKNAKSEIRYPPQSTLTKNMRLWTRGMMILSLMIIAYFYSKRPIETKFALQKETLQERFQKIQCSETYLADIKLFPQCMPKFCGRFVTDRLVNTNEIETLFRIAETGIALGGSSGGVSILDLHSGALSKGENFINFYTLPEANKIYKEEHIQIYKAVKNKIKNLIARQFSIDEKFLHLTYPTFFSKMNTSEAKSVHDEYWHPHVDKDTYSSFHYTSLLYLSDYGHEFTGGRFIFIENEKKNKTIISIEPKRGRLSFFTSGRENTHYVEKLRKGERYAITISFTCDPQYAITDAAFDKKFK